MVVQSDAKVEVVKASAGSGKTYRLAVKYIAAALQGIGAFRHILAVTFTNKATKEMKSRIVEKLYELSCGKVDSGFLKEICAETGLTEKEIKKRSKQTLDDILSNYQDFAVSTIDRFSQRIIRSFFRELDLDISYKVVIDTTSSVTVAIDRLITKSTVDDNIRKVLDRMVEELLADGKKLNFKRELAGVFGGYSKVSRGGVGDINEMMTLYSQMKGQYKENVKLLEDKCLEVLVKVKGSGYSVEDFKIGRGSFVTVIEEIAAKHRSSKINLAYFKDFCKLDSSKIDNLKNQIDKGLLLELVKGVSEVMDIYHSTLCFNTTFELLQANFYKFALLSGVANELQIFLSELGQLALDDSSSLLGRITGGAGVPFIFEKLGEQYNYIFIDEFQDTSTEQWSAFLPLIEGIISKAQGVSVMLIGDIKQAIYRFRGGDWKLLGGGVQGELECREVSLDTSWRSEKRIVEFNNSAIRGIVKVANRVVEDFLGNGNEELKGMVNEAYGDAQQRVSPGKQKDDAGYVEVCCDDKNATLEWLCDRVKNLQKGKNAQIMDIAVLARNNGDLVEVAQEFIRQGIEFQSNEALKLQNSKSVRFLISCLKYSLTSDPVELAVINDTLGREFSATLEQKEQKLMKNLPSEDLTIAIDLLIEHFELSNDSSELLFLQTIQDVAHKFSVGDMSYGGLAMFISEWEAQYSTTSVPLSVDSGGGGGVQILTVHKSKGLEFDVVFVPFATWGLFPKHYNDFWSVANGDFSKFGEFPVSFKPEVANSEYASGYYKEGIYNLLDQINAFYVAITRAKSQLYLGLGEKKANSKSVTSKTIASLFEQEEFYGGNGVWNNKGTKIEIEEKKDAKDKIGREITLAKYFGNPIIPVKFNFESSEQL